MSDRSPLSAQAGRMGPPSSMHNSFIVRCDHDTWRLDTYTVRHISAPAAAGSDARRSAVRDESRSHSRLRRRLFTVTTRLTAVKPYGRGPTTRRAYSLSRPKAVCRVTHHPTAHQKSRYAPIARPRCLELLDGLGSGRYGLGVGPTRRAHQKSRCHRRGGAGPAVPLQRAAPE
eukprot:2323272-Prymnesium_polylepis.1